MPTDAHRERNKRYKQTQDQIVVTVPKGARSEIKTHAIKKSGSMNSYTTKLIENDIGLSMEELAQKSISPQK